MEIREGLKYDISYNGKRWYQIKKVLQIHENKAIVILRPDFEDVNWTGVIEYRNGNFHNVFTCQYDNSLLDDLDKRELNTFLML